MSNWPVVKAKRVLDALFRIGWRLKRQSGSHRTLSREDWPDAVFAFHDEEEIGRNLDYALRARTAGRSAGVGRRNALAGTVTTATVLPVMSKNSTEYPSSGTPGTT